MAEATAVQQNDRITDNKRRIKYGTSKWGITIYKLAIVCTGILQ